MNWPFQIKLKWPIGADIFRLGDMGIVPIVLVIKAVLRSELDLIYNPRCANQLLAILR